MKSIFIALLRGINVGGHKKIPMAELRTLLSELGFENVETYIQSGNVIFQSTEIDQHVLEKIIHNAIKNHFGFEVPVWVRTRLALNIIFNNCPFILETKVNSYFTMLSEAPNKDLVAEASQKVYPNEDYQIIDDCIYFYSADGYGKAKFSLNYFERKLKVNATSRNYKTMLKLLSLSDI